MNELRPQNQTTDSLQLTRQMKVVNDAMNNIDEERQLVGFTMESIRRHFEYVYTIGHFDGRKLIGRGKPVAQFKDGKQIDTFMSASDASRAMGLTKTAVMKCLSGHSRTCAGFEWIYI
jgi:hypothetical protein